MNLHGIVSGAIGSVNPFIDAVVKRSSGYTTLPSGKRTPNYLADLNITVQKQALTGKDLKQLDGLNIQGVVEKVYVNGNFEGIFRALGKGGDLFIMNGQTYLVLAVLERWPDWCSVGLGMQVE